MANIMLNDQTLTYILMLQVELSCQDPVEIILAVVKPVMLKKNLEKMSLYYINFAVKFAANMNVLQTQVLHIPDPATKAAYKPLPCLALSCAV